MKPKAKPKPNAAAKAVRSPLYRPRAVRPKRGPGAYQRKPKHKGD